MLLEYRRGLCTLFEDDEEGEPTPPPMVAVVDDDAELLLLLNEGDAVRVVDGEEGLEWVDEVLEYECWIGIECECEEGEDEEDDANLDEAAPPSMPLFTGFSDVGVDGDDDDMVCVITLCYKNSWMLWDGWMDFLAVV